MIGSRPGYLCLVSLLLASAPLSAADHALLIGGGPEPEQSQVSIERNIIWIDRLLRQRAFASQQLLFTAGTDQAVDIIEQQPDDANIRHWLPLARLFGAQHDALAHYRPNEVPHIEGQSSATEVANTLAQSLGRLQQGDSLLLVYNGHGGWESDDPSENTLRLWGNSLLDVRKFSRITRLRPTGTTLRYIMPQCFSGGFVRNIADDVVHPDPQHIDTQQCGFFSVPDNMESEGCTRSIDSTQYRDYSTWFFAALSGNTRHGKPIKPALPADTPVTLADAHTWAYINGVSTDIPFTSSEYFLELWQPWYTRWHTAGQPDENNPYYQTALALANKLQIPVDTPATMAKAAIEARQTLREAIARTNAQLDELREQEAAIRNNMLQTFDQLWPAARHPYSAAYQALLQNQAEQMLDWIARHPRYPALEQLQQKIEQTQQHRLELRRQAAGHARLQRMLKLASIRDHFDRQANAEARSTYAALRQCESWALPEQTQQIAPDYTSASR